ncbi:uncharacterized protein LOC127261865 [Andrographis paniculata]|uniref:uncharacterized protein LOC127261865 n=1 Tax=Andrographis paniculata TaxID=175694 RepID=UPI0021E8700E|nr:uncharacterized protein LOC127261865 [Andrographis paniculata]
MGPHEPYWRTNSSFSPPPSRWDFQFQPEALSFGSHDGVQLFGSSASSNSRESRGWVRGSQTTNHQFLVSEGVGPYLSSPSISPTQQWTPPVLQEISTDDYNTSRRDVVLRPISFSPAMEGTSAAQESGGSTSSPSESSSEYDCVVKPHSFHRNRRSFMSKAIHPLSLPSEPTARESNAVSPPRLPDFDGVTPHRRDSGSIDLTELPDPLDYDLPARSRAAAAAQDNFKCSLCDRLLSQRSPWSSRRIVKSGDMPVAGVLSCRHVFHAECLEQTTPKARGNDPPCPVCVKIDDDGSSDPRVFSKLRNAFPRLKPFYEDEPSSKPWGCAHVGDCVEGALHTPARNTLLSLNRSRFRKTLSLKGSPAFEFPGKSKKGESIGPQRFSGSLEHGAAGPSKMAAATATNLK